MTDKPHDAAIEAALAEQGWKLVPVEPTVGMGRALTNSWKSVENAAAYVGLGSFREDYQAMLAVAPKPEGE